jgi:hypothetical protein
VLSDITPEQAGHILFNFAVPGPYYPAGDFTQLLIQCIARADHANLRSFGKAFPGYTTAFVIAQTNENGIPFLQAIVAGNPAETSLQEPPLTDISATRCPSRALSPLYQAVGCSQAVGHQGFHGFWQTRQNRLHLWYHPNTVAIVAELPDAIGQCPHCHIRVPDLDNHIYRLHSLPTIIPGTRPGGAGDLATTQIREERHAHIAATVPADPIVLAPDQDTLTDDIREQQHTDEIREQQRAHIARTARHQSRMLLDPAGAPLTGYCRAPGPNEGDDFVCCIAPHLDTKQHVFWDYTATGDSKLTQWSHPYTAPTAPTAPAQEPARA